MYRKSIPSSCCCSSAPPSGLWSFGWDWERGVRRPRESEERTNCASSFMAVRTSQLMLPLPEKSLYSACPLLNIPSNNVTVADQQDRGTARDTVTHLSRDDAPLSIAHCIFCLSLARTRRARGNRTKNSQQKLKWQIDGKGEEATERRRRREGIFLKSDDASIRHHRGRLVRGSDPLLPFKFNSRKFICMAAAFPQSSKWENQ